jgi:hypothetical protein
MGSNSESTKHWGGSTKVGLLAFAIGGLIDCLQIYFGNPGAIKTPTASS